MKMTGRITYQLVAMVVLAALSIGATVGLFWLDFRHRAIPLQPAPIASRQEQGMAENSRQEQADGGEQPAAAERIAAKTHVVIEGETLSQIAALYGVDTDTLYGANPELSDVIHPGDKLVVLPKPGVLHRVADGETLWEIGRRYNVDTDRIAKVNGLNSDFIISGQTLFIPDAKPVRSANTSSRAGFLRFNWPVNGELSSAYGYRWGRLHAGIDIMADYGQPVRSARNGSIRYAGWYGGYGNTVVIEHGQGYSTLYGHLSEYAVSTGEMVDGDAVIGYAGSTGLSTGPHLHFEIRRQGSPVNPLLLLP